MLTTRWVWVKCTRYVCVRCVYADESNVSNYGTFVPVPAYFRSRERKFHRWNFRSLELSLPGTFVPGIESTVELSLPNIIYVLTCWNLALYFVCLIDRTLM